MKTSKAVPPLHKFSNRKCLLLLTRPKIGRETTWEPFLHLMNWIIYRRR